MCENEVDRMGRVKRRYKRKRGGMQREEDEREDGRLSEGKTRENG